MSNNEFGFCSCFPCGVDDGPCVNYDECKDNVFCGYKNCPASFDDNDNCCTKNEVLKSPNFPFKYYPNTKKNWLLTAPVGSIIILQFHSFHVRLIVECKNRTKYEFIYFCSTDSNTLYI